MPGMTERITIYPEPRHLSPYQQRKGSAPDIVNENFLGGFSDVLDAVNPLQHIPILSSMFREAAASPISTGARILGGTLFGGPVGLIAGIINSIMEQETGKDVGGNLMAMFADGEEEQEMQLASTDSSRAAQANTAYQRASALM
jgi:hypothetical protein